MNKGWDATGLLEPLWGRVGGRDRLAALTGIQAPTLSGYNTGRLPLGLRNAEKVASALGVTVFDLGAPTAEAEGPAAQSVLDRLEEAEAALRKLGPDLVRLARRVSALEQQVQPRKRRGGSAG